MSTTVTVRTATLGDYTEMCGLLAAVDEIHRLGVPWMFQEPRAEPRSTESFERLLSSQESTVLVAEVDSRVEGVATALLRSAPEFAVFVKQSWGVLDNIAIAPSTRRRGLGTALTRAAERWMEAGGAQWIELGVYEFNEGARAFYQALGYLPVLTKLRKPLPELR